MKVTLVDNLLLERRGDTYHFDTQPHLGLISLLSVLRQDGHEGHLVDPKLSLRRGSVHFDDTMYEALADEVLSTGADVVGLTSLGCNFIGTARIAEHLKRERPDLPVLLGGPHASILDEPILRRYGQFDVIVRGEAELTLGPLLDTLGARDLGALEGITYRRGDEIIHRPDGPTIADLSVLPVPDYSAYPIADLHLDVLRVEAGRGCPFACTFCSTASFFGRRYRLHSTERLCAELTRLNEAYGITHFALTHDLFTVNKAKVLEFCEGVADLGFTWSCSARMDCVDPHLLRRMSEAGCRSIYYGVETGSRRMQAAVSKRLDLDLFWPTLEATRAVGIEATTSFITGYPQETQADQDDTLDLIGAEWIREPDSVVIQLHLLTPEPGTALLDEFRDTLEWDGHVSDFNLPALEHGDDTIMAGDAEVFVNHHYYRSTVPRERNVLVTGIHPLLYRLTMPLQRHLLGRFADASLAAFFQRVYDWWRTEAPDVEPGDDLVIRFATDAWGRHDYLTSLLRYMLAATAPERQFVTNHFQPLPDRPAPTSRAGQTLMVSPRAALLVGLHDCPAILELLGAADRPEATEVPARLRGVIGDYVIVPSPTGEQVRTIAVSADATGLLESLATPTTRDELTAALSLRAAAVPEFDILLDHLLEIGVLAPVPIVPTGRAPLATHR
ncbi:MAG TPA: radical SAM protein [Ornithinibacter sp.]|nr:radical SAM protein [Ornithinibacter sp.]